MTDELKQRIETLTKQGYWCIESGVIWIAGYPDYRRTFAGKSEVEAWQKLFDALDTKHWNTGDTEECPDCKKAKREHRLSDWKSNDQSD